MFFTGTIAATGATLVNFQTDIIGILTGTITDASGLSSAFQSGTSTFINTVAPGWSLYDAAAGTASNGVTPKVISAPWSDNGLLYKNVNISSTASNQLGFNGSELWNNTTHTGTNLGLSGPVITMTASSRILISASTNHILISLQPTDTTGCTQLICFTEFTRDDPWNVVSNGYPAWVQIGQISTGNVTSISTYRLYNPATLSDNTSINLLGIPGPPGIVLTPNALFPLNVTASASAGGMICGQNTNIHALNSIIGADSNKAAAKYLFDMCIRQCSSSGYTVAPWLGGNISEKNNFLYYAANNLGSIGDDFIVGANTYRLITQSVLSTARLAIKKA